MLMMGWLGDEAAASLMMVLGRVSEFAQQGKCQVSLCYAHHTSCLLPATRAAGFIFGVEAIAEYNLRDDDVAAVAVLARFCAMLLLPKEPPIEPTNARMCSNGRR
jgi:hypothetical protein